MSASDLSCGMQGLSLQHLDSRVVAHRLSCPTACGILVPRPGGRTLIPCTADQSLNRWTTRKVPYIVTLKPLVLLSYLMIDDSSEEGPGQLLSPTPTRKELYRPQSVWRNHRLPTLLCLSGHLLGAGWPGTLLDLPFAVERLSPNFLQIFILLKSSSLLGVLRLKTTVSCSHTVTRNVNWPYL